MHFEGRIAEEFYKQFRDQVASQTGVSHAGGAADCKTCAVIYLVCSWELLSQVLQEFKSSQGELLVLAPCPGAKDPAEAQALKTQAPELYQEWEEAGLLAPAEMLAGLEQLGYSWRRGLRAGVGMEQEGQGSSSGGGGGGGGSSSWVSVPVDITLEVPGKPEEKVALVVSGDTWVSLLVTLVTGFRV